MKLDRLRLVVGVGVILGQIGLMFDIGSRVNKTLEGSDVLTLCLITAPLLATYATAVVRHFVSHATAPASNVILRFGMVFIAIVYPLAMIIASFWAIHSYGTDGAIKTPTLLKNVVSGIQVFLGVYVGVTIDYLFPSTYKPDRGVSARR